MVNGNTAPTEDSGAAGAAEETCMIRAIDKWMN